MNLCVRSGDPKLSFCNSFATTHHVPSSEYEVAELTWEKGQLAMYGLGPQRVHNKPPTDTLESIVDQATLPHSKSTAAYKVVPWLDAARHPSVTAATMDALVPCKNSVDDRENSTQVPGMGSSSGAGAGGCLARGGCRSYASASASPSDAYGGREASLDSYGVGPTSTSLWSPENTSSGEDYTKTSGEDRGFVTQSRSQRQQAGDRGNRKLGIGKSSILAKSKAAAVHNQSERRRRDKINQRMKTLQKMVPNSSKSDKASMLDEVIEYMKQLQAQVGMMSRMSMMMPSPMQLQMSMMAAAAAMGMGMPPPIMPAAAFMPALPWDIHPQPLTPPPDFLPNVFACQSQPMTMDGYSSRLAALYQQFGKFDYTNIFNTNG